MESKPCTKCGKTKPIEEFHSYFCKSLNRVRIKSECKKCSNQKSLIRARIYYKSDKFLKYRETETFKKMRRAANARFRKTLKRKLWARAYQKTKKQKEWRKEYNKKFFPIWLNFKNGREIRNRYSREYRKKHRDKANARNAVQRALNNGSMERPSVCSECFSNGIIETHHYLGYAKENWLNIKWICKDCHYKAHELIRLSVPITA